LTATTPRNDDGDGHVVIRARPRESIYRLIYSVIIWSAIARALDDGKDSHVNEIPNVSIVANVAWEYRDHRIRTSSSKRIPWVLNSRARNRSEPFVLTRRRG